MTSVAGLGGEFCEMLTRLGSCVAGRYHVAAGRMEHDYELIDVVLGKGCTGDVVLARSTSDNARKFAVKTVYFSALVGMDDWKMLEKELEIILLADHPRVLAICDIYETPEAVHLVMPCMEGGQLIDDDNAPAVLVGDAKELAAQMLQALRYSHSRGIVHRDVKPANFMFEQKDRDLLKVIDFGFSAFWKPGDVEMRTRCGTPGYRAPELLSGRGYTSKVDLWSLGVTLFRLMVGEMPFPGQAVPVSQEDVDTLMSSELVVGLPPDALHFLAALLRTDPAQRPTAESALGHPFLISRQCQPSSRVPTITTRTRNQGGCTRPRRQPQQRSRRHVTRASAERCGGGRHTATTSADTAVELKQLLDAFDEAHRPLREPVASSRPIPLAVQAAKMCWADAKDDEDLAQQVAKPRWADLEDDMQDL